MEDVTRQEFEEGDVFVYRNGKLERWSRSDEARVRSIRITESAYQAAKQIAKGMRVNGYKPDVSLVASALMVHGSRDEGKEAVRKFVLEMFAMERQGKGKQE